MTKKIRPEFVDKSLDYIDGYSEAEDYFNVFVKDGIKIGSAIFRTFVEVVSYSVRNNEPISQERKDTLKYILKWSDTEFNKGVYDLLCNKIDEYNARRIGEEKMELHLKNKNEVIT